MNPAAKILLFLLAAPILLAVFLLFVPLLLIVLLVVSLFLPSVRIFHFARTPDGNTEREAAGQEEASRDGDAVYDVECTVVDTSEDSEESDAAGQQPKLKS